MPEPVPSLTPVATQKLWTKLVHRPHPFMSMLGCRSLRAVFYTESDWLRLATKLANNPANATIGLRILKSGTTYASGDTASR